MAVGLGLAAMSSATVVDAQGKGKGQKTAAAPAAPVDPPTTKRPLVLIPAGITWGMNHKQVAAVIDKMLDEEYRPLYQKTSPGVKMKALDAQLAEEKSAFKRSRIDFGSLPTGFDAGPLKGEYSYLNKESVMVLTRTKNEKKTTTYYFFIQDRVWKIIDERKLGEGSAYGKDFAEATAKLAATIGTPGRVLAADFNKGRNATEVDWKDATSHLRVIQRGDDAFAVALEDLVTLGNLASLRTNKPPEDSGIDPAVAAATRKEEPPPGPPAAAEKNPKKKK